MRSYKKVAHENRFVHTQLIIQKIETRALHDKEKDNSFGYYTIVS